MTKTNIEPVEASVIEALPNAMFRLQLADGESVIGFISGKMRVNKIKVLVGDKVLVILDPYKGKTSNRITRRL
jgi:translation initiation factor IF-1